MSECREMAAQERAQQALALDTAQATAEAVMQVMAPMMQGLTQITATMAQMAQQMRMMQETVSAMQKAMMRSMPLTPVQARLLGEAIRDRAAAVAAEYGLPDEARRACMREIRRKLCRRWAVTSAREIPSSEFELAQEAVARFDESEIVERYL